MEIKAMPATIPPTISMVKPSLKSLELVCKEASFLTIVVSLINKKIKSKIFIMRVFAI